MRICCLTFLVSSDAILQLDGTSKQKQLRVLCVSEQRVNDDDYQIETASSIPVWLRVCIAVNRLVQ